MFADADLRPDAPQCTPAAHQDKRFVRLVKWCILHSNQKLQEESARGRKGHRYLFVQEFAIALHRPAHEQPTVPCSGSRTAASECRNRLQPDQLSINACCTVCFLRSLVIGFPNYVFQSNSRNPQKSEPLPKPPRPYPRNTKKTGGTHWKNIRSTLD